MIHAVYEIGQPLREWAERSIVVAAKTLEELSGLLPAFGSPYHNGSPYLLSQWCAKQPVEGVFHVDLGYKRITPTAAHPAAR